MQCEDCVHHALLQEKVRVLEAGHEMQLHSVVQAVWALKQPHNEFKSKADYRHFNFYFTSQAHCWLHSSPSGWAAAVGRSRCAWGLACISRWVAEGGARWNRKASWWNQDCHCGKGNRFIHCTDLSLISASIGPVSEYHRFVAHGAGQIANRTCLGIQGSKWLKMLYLSDLILFIYFSPCLDMISPCSLRLARKVKAARASVYSFLKASERRWFDAQKDFRDFALIIIRYLRPTMPFMHAWWSSSKKMRSVTK